MRVLISNDDGIYSPGIAVLADVASQYAEVRIVAPDVEQSSMGQAITSNRPLTYRRTPLKSFEAYRVNGTPADCVALGVHLWEKVDWVLSGINLGPNLGTGLWHSGTLAAAKQAVLLGLRGIAFSTPTKDDDPRFEELRPHVAEVLKLLMQESSPRLLNVNIPPTHTASAGRANPFGNTTAKWYWMQIQWDGSTIGLLLFLFRNPSQTLTDGR